MSHETYTPLMQQYHDVRAAYPDTLLFFQVGDFYELFFDDAKIAAPFLGIALTSRGTNNGEPIPLCGVPMHAKDHYLHKLVKGGFKVALCDQVEEAQSGKLVKRAVTQVLTPGTLTDSKLLDEKAASYLFSFYPSEHEWALLFIELLTAQLWATLVPAQSERTVELELARFFPHELLIPDVKAARNLIPFFRKQGYFTTVVAGDVCADSFSAAKQWFSGFSEQTQKLLEKHEAMRLALYYFYAYVQRTHHASLDQFNQLFVYQSDDFLVMDAATQRNLELVRNAHDGGDKNTLFVVVDGASTPMGSRMIKKWIQRPLVKKEAIVQRHEVISRFIEDVPFLQTMRQLLSAIGDIERIIGRILLERAQSYDYLALRKCLEIVPSIRHELSRYEALSLVTLIFHHLEDLSDLSVFLQQSLSDDLSNGCLIKKGFDQQLDYMRDLIMHGNQRVVDLERTEQEQTKIPLKIRYNTVHGYYIEITNTHKHLIPDRYIRRQTLIGKERYITPELQQCAYEIERAHAQIAAGEQELFKRVKQYVSSYRTPLRKLAHALAHLDALHGFAMVAYNNGYIRPTFTDTRDIVITGGRHPVVEHSMQAHFIPNDTHLTDDQPLWIITGPNMGGKSTYLRQVALMCVMAQSGAFIPAQRAQLTVLDRIFTRIGAGDNLAVGKSTFLVEMEETASICTQATEKSLVILDEVGRGTSTFDGLAIARAVLEYLYLHVRARCLFATHYHELTSLHTIHQGIVPFYMASKKTDMGIIFLYKIVRGVADGSFGIEVARLAGIPEQIIVHAQQYVFDLTQGNGHTRGQHNELSTSGEITKLHDQLEELRCYRDFGTELQNMVLDELTPRQAFDLLWRWKKWLDEKGSG